METKINFTNASLGRLLPQAKSYTVSSTNYPSLFCRVNPSGTKALEVRRRARGETNATRVKICNWGDLPLSSSNADERSIVREYRRVMDLLDEGKNPNGERQHKVKNNQAAQITVSRAFDEYVEQSQLTKNAAENYRRYLRLQLHDWAKRYIGSITPKDVLDMHKKIGRTTAVTANAAVKAFRAVYNYQLTVLVDPKTRAPLLPPNPVSNAMKKNWNKEKRKATAVYNRELEHWWEVSNNTKALGGMYSIHKQNRAIDGQLAKDYFQFILLTGLRKSEALKIKASDFIKRAGVLRVPDTKNGEWLDLPLSGYCREILERRTKELKPDEKVFQIGYVQVYNYRFNELFGREVTNHDLRRTFTKIATNCGVNTMLIKTLLNHVSGADSNDDVTFGYMAWDEDAVADALQKITDYMLSLKQ